MVEVDCRGMVCPQPIIATRKAMREQKEGTEISVLLDNRTSYQNVQTLLTGFGCTLETQEADGAFRVTFHNPHLAEELLAPSQDPTTCPTSGEGATLLCATNVLGEGDATLGAILMKGFLSTLVEWTPIPRSILFLNSGVKLCLKDSGALETLKALEAKGTELIICGTCVDYYKVRELVSVGTIGNMQTISERLAKATKVVRL